MASYDQQILQGLPAGEFQLTTRRLNKLQPGSGRPPHAQTVEALAQSSALACAHGTAVMSFISQGFMAETCPVNTSSPETRKLMLQSYTAFSA
ncbi:hypothetical protein [Pannonibacter indicus]|uniref:hypothetical protein n=1 Tax=Pannonibacter indicus TaxID=466044 RepID=UPI00391BDB1B